MCGRTVQVSELGFRARFDMGLGSRIRSQVEDWCYGLEYLECMDG